ncbi:class I SAM-dependent methyltransferase [Candidatus Omnitrophota bacterium]
MEIKQCPICKNRDLIETYQTDRFPCVSFSVLKEEKRSILRRYSENDLFLPLRIVNCGKCRHSFQTVKPDEQLMDMVYGKCYNYPSPILSDFVQDKEKMFLDFFFNEIYPICRVKKLDKVFEIACFDGFILKGLSKKGFKVSGCDPSKGADIANDFGIKVHKRNFDSSYFIKRKKSFDIVIFRHFIEHVHDPVSLLRDVKKILNPNGLIIFETPNAEHYIKNGSFETFHLQHLHHFSIYSAGELLKKASLKLTRYKVTPENMIVVASGNGKSLSVGRRPAKGYAGKFKEDFQKNAAYLKDCLASFSDHKKKIVLWGAGGLCGYFFSLYDVDGECISYVVDSDKRKWDMCFINNRLKVYSPQKLLSEEIDLIIITSMYSRSILRQIEEMGIASDVISLHPNISYIKKRP